jgi:hypothetical protein
LRRSLRKIDRREAESYAGKEPLFTVTSLEEARQQLIAMGRDPAEYCFFSWMEKGVRYFRVWEDERWKEGVVRAVPFGQVAARLKRSEAEKLFTVTRRYRGTLLHFEWAEGALRVYDGGSTEPVTALSVPQVGGDLVFLPGRWSPEQAAHFCNAILVRGMHPDQAYAAAESLGAEVRS